MERRVERILTGRGKSKGLAIGWSGTFHAVGARLLRDFAPPSALISASPFMIGRIPPIFSTSISPSIGFVGTGAPISAEGHLPRHLFAGSELGHALDQVLLKHFPWCAAFEDDLRRLFEGYVEAKQSQHVLD